MKRFFLKRREHELSFFKVSETINIPGVLKNSSQATYRTVLLILCRDTAQLFYSALSFRALHIGLVVVLWQEI